VPATNSYDYALVRIVPSVERGECINVGVILFCRTRRFLGMRLHVDEQRLRSLAPHLDIEAIQRHLASMLAICEGKRDSGPIGQLSQSERFHWLVSPRSTIIQISPVHSGLCPDPQAMLERLLQKMVLIEN